MYYGELENSQYVFPRVMLILCFFDNDNMKPTKRQVSVTCPS